MPATFFIGDPHFYHEKVSLIRGFDNVHDHNASIVRKWFKQVKDDDLVYITGDCSGGRKSDEAEALVLLESLPGRKRLIAGNHDSVSGIHYQTSPNQILFDKVFEKITDYGHINLNGRRILLSHYPYWVSGDGPFRLTKRYEQFRMPDLGNWLIHAHTHHSDPLDGGRTGREINTSWDAWGRLVDLGDIAQLIKKTEN